MDAADRIRRVLMDWRVELERLDRISQAYPTDLTTGQLVVYYDHIKQLEEILYDQSNRTGTD